MNSSERRSAQRSSPRLLLSLFIAVLAVRGQFYIGSTFAGTRPRLDVGNASGVQLRGYVDQVWEECAQILSTGLSDIGDAGRIWLQNSYVGTNGAVKSTEGKYGCKCLIPEVHAEKQPKLSAIVQSFNHHNNVKNISEGLKKSQSVEEIVICEDGSTDGSLHDWHGVLTEKEHFIIRSNNLHELRSYNRAMRMSSGDLVVLLQDDDLLPPNDEWVQNALRLFEALPELGVLGGYIGQLWNHSTGQGLEYGEQRSTHGGLRQGDTKPLQYVEPTTGLPFMYVECVWIAPVFVRRSLLRKAGGLELTIAKRGEPGVWQDCVYSYEAWVNGYTVGAYSAVFERGVGGHGSATSTAKVKQRERVYERAVAYTNRKFPRRRIHDGVVTLNNKTLIPRTTQ